MYHYFNKVHVPTVSGFQVGGRACGHWSVSVECSGIPCQTRLHASLPRYLTLPPTCIDR